MSIASVRLKKRINYSHCYSYGYKKKKQNRKNRRSSYKFGVLRRKGERMDEDINTSELLVEKAEENQTRKILEILKDSKDIEDAVTKVKALLIK